MEGILLSLEDIEKAVRQYAREQGLDAWRVSGNELAEIACRAQLAKVVE